MMKTKCFEASVNNKDFEFGGKKIKIKSSSQIILANINQKVNKSK